MPARRAIGWIYDHMTHGLPAESVDEIDAALGDRGAVARVNERRLTAVAGVEGEIG